MSERPTHTHVVLLGTGSRDMPDNTETLEMVHADLDLIEASIGPIVFVVEGGARGADSLIRRVATSRKLPRATIPAQWDRFGKRAGVLRNESMRDFVAVVAASIGEVVGLAYPAPESVGTRHMMGLIEERGWRLRTHEIEGS